MSAPKINLDLRTFDKPDAETIKMIDNILIAFNEEKMATERKPTAIVAYDRQEFVGGIYFRRYGQSAVIDYLAVIEDRRGQGIGQHLMAAAEKKLQREGCHHITLETMSHQAPDFYRELGYKDIASIPEYYDRNTRFVLRKTLMEGSR